MIRIDSVSKRFGPILALNGVTFQVGSGEIVGFLGPNGAGKTTMMRILACFLPPTSGSVSIDGLNVETDSLAIRRKIGYFLEKVSVYPDMRVAEFLGFVAEIKRVPVNLRKKGISEAMDACGLGRVRQRIIGNLSKGYRQRVGLAQALLNNPALLLLDEPTIGLDPKQVIEIRSLIKGLAGERTVVLSTHILSEVSQVCDKIVIIDEGRIVAVDTPEGLSLRLQELTSLHVQIEAFDGMVIEEMNKVPGIVQVEKEEDVSENVVNYLIKADEGIDVPRELCALAFNEKWILREIRPEKMSLEDAFLKLVTRERLSS